MRHVQVGVQAAHRCWALHNSMRTRGMGLVSMLTVFANASCGRLLKRRTKAFGHRQDSSTTK